MRTPRRLVPFALAAAAVLALAVAFTFLAAQRSVRHATEQARTEGHLAFTLRPLDPAQLRAQSPAFAAIAAPESFTAGVAFRGEFYLAGPRGLSVYTAGGALKQELQTGLDLPPSPLTALLVGQPRGASEPQILIATAGAGLLLVTPGQPLRLHQLLPADAGKCDLTALAASPSGEILLGTRNHGVLAFDGTTLTEARNLPRNLQVTALSSSGGNTLIGTRNGGAYHLHGGLTDHLTGLPDDTINTLALTPTHAYLGTPRGIADLNFTDGTTRILAPGLFTQALLATPTELTAGTLDQGIQTIALSPAMRLRTASFAPSSERTDALFTAGNRQLALSDGKLLVRTGSAWSPALPGAARTLTDRNISALAFSPEGHLWVGFFDRGLDILSADLALSRHLEDDHLFCLNRLLADPVRGTMAAATANGLVLFDAAGNPRQTLTRQQGLISDHINDLAFTPAGLTVATPAGLTFLTPSGPESLYAFQGLVNNHVYTLAQGSDPRQLLAGTLGGLSLLTSGQVTRNITASTSGLKHNWITALAEAPGGGWLVGTYGAGIERLSPSGVFTPQDMPRDLIINPNALLVTPTATYAGTLGRGLLVFERSTGRWTLVTHGLPSLNVTAFAARTGELYVGTENGLVQIPEAALATFLAGGPA